VAITSKRPLQSDYHELSLTVGNHQQRWLGLDFGGAVAGRDDLSYRLVAKGSAADQQQNGASTERYVLAPSLNWKISDSTNLLLQAYLQKDPSTGYHGTLPYYGTVVPHNGKTISTSFNEGSSGDGMRRDQQYFGYQLEHRFNDALTFRQQYRLQLSKTDLSQYSDVGWVSDSSDLLNRTYARSSERSTAHIIDNNLEARFSALGSGTPCWLAWTTRPAATRATTPIPTPAPPSTPSTPCMTTAATRCPTSTLIANASKPASTCKTSWHGATGS
jgi:iron complex outermembrane receptor protein